MLQSELQNKSQRQFGFSSWSVSFDFKLIQQRVIKRLQRLDIRIELPTVFVTEPEKDSPGKAKSAALKSTLFAGRHGDGGSLIAVSAGVARALLFARGMTARHIGIYGNLMAFAGSNSKFRLPGLGFRKASRRK